MERSPRLFVFQAAEEGDPNEMNCRGIRGATTVLDAEQASTEEATVELVNELRNANCFAAEDVVAAIFTLPEELNGANPAAALRNGIPGWEFVPLLVMRAHDVELVPRCVRILLLVNSPLSQREIRHVYLRGAEVLRPDLNHVGGELPWSS